MKQRTAWEIFAAFLWLGCTSFGGPVAHIGYYRAELVRRRRWLSEEALAEIVGFCQMLPGPGSSQTGFTIGLVTGGWAGALAAWAAFTLPSTILMTAFAFGRTAIEGRGAAGAIHGLQLVAVAVVAQAVLGMRRALAPDLRRCLIALAAAALVLSIDGFAGQLAAIGSGAAAGLALCRTGAEAAPLSAPVSKRAGAAALTVLGLLFFLPGAPVFSAFFRTGALVFGGGHVVLPLLESVTVGRGWVDERTFLTGYGAAQAIPGPLFTFAAYLGAVLKQPPNGIEGAAVALAAIFLPGLLLVVGILPFWSALRGHRWVRSALAGVNAAVVGILGAALYWPVWLGAVHSYRDFAIALSAFLMLAAAKLPPWAVVILGAALSSIID